MQVAQSGWIGSRYRAAVLPAFRARRLDPAVISWRTILKYLTAMFLPAFFVDGARRRGRARRVPGEPDPWLDLP